MQEHVGIFAQWVVRRRLAAASQRPGDLDAAAGWR